MVALKAPGLLHSKTQRTHVMPSPSSMAMTGKVVCWRSAKTDLLVRLAVATRVVADLEAWDVEVFEAAMVVLGVVLEEATADVVATEVGVVVMAVRLLAVLTMLLRQALPLRYLTPSPTTPRLEEK